MKQIIPLFRTSAGEAAYQAAYQRTLDLWPAERESVAVPTSYGETRVNTIGPFSRPALVFLHGFGFSSTQWYPNVPMLMSHFRIYAPDVPGQLGLSKMVRPMKNRANYTHWLEQLLDELAIEDAILVGHSHGGWLAAIFAIERPKRVKRLVLISPSATLARLSPMLFMNGILVALLHREHVIYRMVGWLTTRQDYLEMKVIDQFRIGIQNLAFRPTGVPNVFKPEEFKQLSMPVQVMIGDHEVIYAQSPEKVLERAAQLIPNVRTVLIENAGHACPLDQPDETNQQLAAFLKIPGFEH
jgi:pimeloyl-ACP methyl ester carboxylesterase